MDRPRNIAAEQTLSQALRANRIRDAFLIIDAARGTDVRQIAAECHVDCRSLYAGRKGAMLADVAPYLLPVEADSKLLAWFASHWGNYAGVMLQARLPFAPARDHLRRLLAATGPSEKKYLMRYYDPRVLIGLLAQADSAQAEPFFGPIAAWHCQDLEGHNLLTFAPQASGVYVRRTPLQTGNEKRIHDGNGVNHHNQPIAPRIATQPHEPLPDRRPERANRYRR